MNTRIPVRRLGLWSALFLLCACRTVSLQSDPTHPDQAAVPNLWDVDWWRPLVTARMWEYAPREPAGPAIDPDTGRVVVATRDGQVRSLSPDDGLTQWTFQTNAPFNAGPLIRDGVVYVPGADGVLYALKARTGDLLWKYQAGEELASTPVWASGKLLVAGMGDALFAVDAKSGQWVWQYRRDSPGGFTIRGAPEPAVDGTHAFFGFSDGVLVALNIADGTVHWEQSLAPAGAKFRDVDAKVVVTEEGPLYAASYASGLFALEKDTGRILWSNTHSGITSLAHRGSVLLATGDNLVAAFAADNGRLLWSYDLKGQAGRQGILVGKHLVVPTNDALLFLDPATGQPQTRWNPGRGVSSTPALGNRRLYVLSNLGTVYALRMQGAEG